MPPGASGNSVADAVAQALSPAHLRGLGRMRLAVRRAVGNRPGNTTVPRFSEATGLEIERYKHYDTGDELRFVDWNAYARLDQLQVRRFRAEREAPLYVFLDTSASMGSPPGDGKLGFAAGVALSLAHVALRRQDPVRFVALGRGPAAAGYTVSPVVRLPALLRRLAEFCARLSPSGPTLLASGIDAFVQHARTPGLAVVLSDFLVDADAWRTALRRLISRGFEVAALRPIGEGERDPSLLFRRARVRDAETGDERSISLGPENLRRYAAALARHLDQVRDDCRSHSSFFATCEIGAGLTHCLFDTLPRAGLLR